MEEIVLVKPASAYADQIWTLRQEILESGDYDSFAGCAGLEKEESCQAWLERIRLWEDPATVPGDHVPATVYLAVRPGDGRVVGIIDLRHHIDHPILGTWGGHIGYSVRPSERGKGYAPQMLRQCVQKARERGIAKLLVTCHPWNAPSERTILSCGGVLEGEITVDGEPVRRYWIDA